MLEDALSFPTRSDDWVGTMLIGGALSLLGFLILPAILVYGYLVRVARAGATGAEPPSFTDWGDLLVDGVKVFALGLGASLVVLVPLAVAAAVGGAVAGVTGSRTFAGVVVLGFLFVLTVAALVVGYFLPAALANFAIEDSLAAAFDVETVVDGALTGEYATAWLFALVVGIVGNLVGGLLTLILVGFVVLFYAQVVSAYLFGRGFAMGLGEAPDVEGPRAPGIETPTGTPDVAADREADETGRAGGDVAGTSDRPPGSATGAGPTDRAGSGAGEDTADRAGPAGDEDTADGTEPADGGPPSAGRGDAGDDRNGNDRE
ncbi:MAG: DUF4013 domain-containing protein [Haloferacaceae archaeon]